MNDRKETMFFRILLCHLVLFINFAFADLCDRLVLQNIDILNHREVHCKDGSAHDVCNANIIQWLQHDCATNIFASIADQCKKLVPKNIQLEQLITAMKNRHQDSFNITCPQLSPEMNFILLSKKSFATENIHKAQKQSIKELNQINQLINQNTNCEIDTHSNFQIKQCQFQKKNCPMSPDQIKDKINFYQQKATDYLEISRSIENIDKELTQIKANLKSWKKTEQQVKISELEKQKSILLHLKNSFYMSYPWLEGNTFKKSLAGRNSSSIQEAMMAQWKDQSNEMKKFQTELSNAELCLSSEQRKCDFNQINSLLYEINDPKTEITYGPNHNKNQQIENRIISEASDMYQCLLESTHIRDDSGNRIKSGLKDVTISALAGLVTGGISTMGRLAVLGTKNLKVAKLTPPIMATLGVTTQLGTSSLLAYRACFQQRSQKNNLDNNDCQFQFQFESEKLEQNCFLTQVTLDAATSGVFHQLSQRLPNLFKKINPKASTNNNSPINTNHHLPEELQKQNPINQIDIEQQFKELTQSRLTRKEKTRQNTNPDGPVRQSRQNQRNFETIIKPKRVPTELISYQNAKSEWSKVNQPLPDDLPYYSLGLNHHLSHFSKQMERVLNRPVNNHAETSLIPISSDSIRKQKMFHIESLKKGALGAALYHIQHSSAAKPILFNLDGISFENYRLYLKNKSPSLSDFTNQEIQILTSDKKYFDHVRWYKNGQELSFEELYQIFHQFNPQLFER